MGCNLGLFCQIKWNKRFFSVPVESDGFTGVFLGGIAYAPAPPWGQGWRKGGCRIRENLPSAGCPGFHPIRIGLLPKFFRQSEFLSGKIWPYKLSSGIFLDFSDFEPEKIRPEKFHANFFCDFQLSTGKFSGF
jgi:hypothetical protein